MKPETKDTLIFYGIMVVVFVVTIVSVISWGISTVWRKIKKEKTI